MSTFSAPVEYAFTLKDGTTRYEIRTSIQDMHQFKRMHDAVARKPVALDGTSGQDRDSYSDTQDRSNYSTDEGA